jgi:hypothetical protein
MRETNMKGATDGNRKGSYVGALSTANRRKPRERVTVNTVASESDLARLQTLQDEGTVTDVTLHVTRRGDVRMVTYYRK